MSRPRSDHGCNMARLARARANRQEQEGGIAPVPPPSGARGGVPAPVPADAARREAWHSSGRAGRRRETHHGASYRPSGRARPRGGPRAKPAGPSRGPFRAVQKSVSHTADFSTGYSGTGDCSEQRGGEHPYVVAQAAYLGQDAVLLAGEEVEVNVGHDDPIRSPQPSHPTRRWISGTLALKQLGIPSGLCWGAGTSGRTRRARTLSPRSHPYF
jgi:hypothetical protein